MLRFFAFKNTSHRKIAGDTWILVESYCWGWRYLCPSWYAKLYQPFKSEQQIQFCRWQKKLLLYIFWHQNDINLVGFASKISKVQFSPLNLSMKGNYCALVFSLSLTILLTAGHFLKIQCSTFCSETMSKLVL